MKKLLSLLTMLIVAISTSWADETYYLQTPGAATPALTGEFYTTAALSQDASCTYDNVAYTKGLAFGGNTSSISGNNYPDRMVRYDCKTTSTELTVVVYNKSTSAKNFYIYDVKESASLGGENTVSALTTVSGAASGVTTKTYSVSSTKGASVYVMVADKSNSSVVQIIAVEKGTALTTPGTSGYSVSFNKGRIVARSGAATTLDNYLEIHQNQNYAAGNTTYAKMQTKGTNYIKFTTTEATKLSVSVSSSSTYYISSTKNASESPAPTAYTATATDVEIAAGTWYIVPNGSNVNVTGLSFAASTPATTYEVTYKANGGTGDDVVDNVSVVGANTFTAPTGKKFVGWNTEADGTGDAYAVGAAVTEPLTLFAQWANTYTQFSMTNITGPTEQVASQDKAPVTATFSTGGSAEVYNAHGTNTAIMVSNNTINLNSSGNSYCHVSFPSKLQAGDEIALGETTGNAYLATTSSKPNSKVAIPYTIPANSSLIGATDLYIFNNKDGGDAEKIASFREFTITGAGKASDLAVTSATPTVAIGATSDIEYTSSSTGAVTFASSNANVATVSSTGVITAVNGGTATITISQDADETYRAGEATVTVTVPERAIIRLTLPGGENTGDAPGTIGGTYNGKTQGRNTTYGGCKLGGTGQYIGLTLATGNSFQEGDVVEIKFVGEAPMTGDDSKVIFYDSKEQTNVIYNTETSPALGTYRYILPEGANGQTSLYLVRGTEKNSKFNPFIDYIAVYRPDATITLNSNGYGTYSKATDFEFAGAKAYKMNLNYTGGTLQGTEVTGKIKAGEGILFKGEAGAKVSIIETAGAEALADNSLVGTTPATGDAPTPDYTSYKYFVLKGKSFVPYTTATTFGAGKAFFQVAKDAQLPASLELVFDGEEATAVEAVAEAKANAVAPVKVIKNGKLFIGNYNVAGQQVK